ncbi:hypothetical protein DID88_008146 [Monilinia fructigena]|uniref:Uncharacterized protein n=1 Tax=Monilinia fructigena TaxID=38457 RepID=A0A395J4I4_9HELO|nr:hypothetical protein DID88_008146 [Monilinia fructigena]
MAVPPQRAICTIRFSPAVYMIRFPLPIYKNFFQRSYIKNQDELRLRWAASIQNLFYTDLEPKDRNYLRNFDIILNVDGSAENYTRNQPVSPVSQTPYPARYQLPEALLDRLSTVEERIARAELFALGSICMKLYRATNCFMNLEKVQMMIGQFRSVLLREIFRKIFWYSPVTPTILICFNPAFLEEMLNSSQDRYKALPIASAAAIPILGAVGFSAIGPIAGSTAAAWQSGIGLVEAGSFFAWCQSAAMGGAAGVGIIGTGVGGAGLLTGATMLQVLDGVDFDLEVLRERFLAAWERLWGRGDEGDE